MLYAGGGRGDAMNRVFTALYGPLRTFTVFYGLALLRVTAPMSLSYREPKGW